MKQLFFPLFIAFGMLSLAAHADNADIENALKDRADLSDFYQALVTTGVIHELQPGQSYTIFAPTNEAFARISRDRYPCFYSVVCRPEVAEIMRNHIIPGVVYIEDAAQEQGGLFSIDNRFVTIGHPMNDRMRSDYAATIGGNNITYASGIRGGMLYKVDGVIADQREWAYLEPMVYASATPEVKRVTTERVESPVCAGGRCVDSVTETTTITHVVQPSFAGQ